MSWSGPPGIPGPAGIDEYVEFADLVQRTVDVLYDNWVHEMLYDEHDLAQRMCNVLTESTNFMKHRHERVTPERKAVWCNIKDKHWEMMQIIRDNYDDIIFDLEMRGIRTRA